MDYQLSKDIHVFGKMTYNWNASAATYYNGYAVYNNKDNTPSEAGGELTSTRAPGRTASARDI